MTAATMERTGGTAGSVWDRYNIIAASGRMARRTLRLRGRGTALGVFFVFANFSILFASLWVIMDLLSTWEWTSFLTPQINAGVDYMAQGVASVATAALFFRIVLQCISFLPTAFELSAPYFADQDELFAAMFIIFSCFDLYTDWPKTSAMAANIDYTSWGLFAPIAQWGFTVALTFIFSFLVQYCMVLFAVIAACAAWVAVMGPRGRE